jgi:hypothetical protein
MHINRQPGYAVCLISHSAVRFCMGNQPHMTPVTATCVYDDDDQTNSSKLNDLPTHSDAYMISSQKSERNAMWHCHTGEPCGEQRGLQTSLPALWCFTPRSWQARGRLYAYIHRDAVSGCARRIVRYVLRPDMCTFGSAQHRKRVELTVEFLTFLHLIWYARNNQFN